MLANLSDESQTVELPGSLVNTGASVRILHAGNAEKAMTDPASFRAPSPTVTTPGGAAPPITRRAILTGAAALLRPRNGAVQLTLDACAIACIDS